MAGHAERSLWSTRPTPRRIRTPRAVGRCLRVPLSLAIVFLLACAAGAGQYVVEPLGNLGADYSRAQAIAPSGAIVGYATTPSGPEWAACFVPGPVSGLGTLGGPASRAYDANDAGLVVGWAQDAAGASWPVLWDAAGVHALPSLGVAGGTARAVNADGLIAGHGFLTATTYHAATWRDAVVTDLGTLGGASSIAYDVNSAGTVAGAADDASGVRRACLWTDAGPTALPSLPGATSSAASGINDAGQVILWNHGLDRASFWDGFAMIDLGTLGGNQSWAYGLNNLGQVVGWAELASGLYQAFVWADANGNHLSDPGEMQDLGTLGGYFSSAYGINDDGVIVGYSQRPTDRGFQWEAVRWMPVPEPGSLLTVGLGLAVMHRRRGRPRRSKPIQRQNYRILRS